MQHHVEPSADLLEVARTFDIKKPERILEQTRSAVADWERYAPETGVPDAMVEVVRRAFDERAGASGC